jgi:hypothetical protein
MKIELTTLALLEAGKKSVAGSPERRPTLNPPLPSALFRADTGEADKKPSLQVRFWGSPWSTAAFGAVEFAGNEAAVPSKRGVGFGNASYLPKSGATESSADLREGGALGIGNAQAGWNVGSRAQPQCVKAKSFNPISSLPGILNPNFPWTDPSGKSHLSIATH